MKTRRTLDTLIALTAALGLTVAGCRKTESRRSETPVATGGPSSVTAANGASYTISGPHSHENLTFFVIHGRDTTSEEFVTLAEGLESGAVVLTEKGGDVATQVASGPLEEGREALLRDRPVNVSSELHPAPGATVNELLIQNNGDQPVYLQAGDIVKGGKQDRTIGQDLVLPPRSGKVPVSAFCVESGRWSSRSGQGLAFDASDYSVNTKGLKLAVMLDANQSRVWEEVEESQVLFQHAFNTSLLSSESPTSLQLTLENDKLSKKVDEYVTALEAVVARHDDAVGYAFSVNGKLNSADVYASNALFKKLWPKLLNAASTEAIGELGGEKTELLCTVNDVAACLSKTGGEEKTKDAGGVTTVSRESKDDVIFETRLGAKSLRWNYLTK